MPVKVKDLYIASSVGELNKFAEINPTWRNKTAQLLCDNAVKVFDAARLAKLDGDQERSYTLFMKFLNLFSYIQKSQEYKKDKVFYDKLVGAKKISKAIEEAEEMQKDLIRRYTDLQNEKEAIKLLKELDLKKQALVSSSISTEVPAVPIANGLDAVIRPSESEPLSEFLKSTELYSLLQQRTLAVIIMDVRKLEYFEMSRIKHDCCINIPADVLQPGMTASKLEKIIPRRSHEWWPRRLTADRIILVDWYGKSEPSPALDVLKAVMLKWDPFKTYRGHIQILEQGYEDWLLRYPMSCTNSLVNVPLRRTESKNGPFETVQVNFSYPSLDETLNDIAGEMSHSLVDNTVEAPSNAPFPYTLPTFNPPVINRSVKPSSKAPEISPHVTITKDRTTSPLPAAKLPSEAILTPKTSNIPVVDRQSKAQALARFNSQLDKDLDLSREQKHLEEEWANVRAKQLAEAEDSIRRILQEREEALLKKLEDCEKQDKEQQRLIQDLRRQLEQQRAQDSTTSKQEDEQKNTEEQESAMREKEEMKKKLDEEVARLRTERKRKQDEAKRAVQEIKSLKPVIEPKETPTPPPTVYKPLRPLTLDTKTVAPSTLNGDEPSLLSPPGRLHRSRSFHNISERSTVKKPEDSSAALLPRVNRTLKPRNDIIRPQPKYREFNPTWGSVEHGLTGLRNLGNTCYMNSILQCLSHTRTFCEYFLKELHLNELSIRNSNCKGVMAEEIGAVISAMWAGHYRSIACRDFKNAVGQFNEPFRGTDQQDAHEFLTVLLDWLSEDLNKSSMKGPPPPLPEDDDGGKLAWEQHKKLHDSIIEHLFVGQQRSVLVCRACGKESVSYEPFNCLSVPLPQKGTKCTLKECLQLYLQGEIINGWVCPKCKGKKEAVKKFDLWKLPPYLIVHLKRFYQDSFLRNYANKRQTHVDFPLHSLDLEDASGVHRYKLYAVSNHYGSMDSGHYTALCLGGPHSQWYRFDDQEISQIDPGQVRTPAAYILFYQRVDGREFN